VLWELPYVNGKMNGIAKSYYESGKVASETKYKKGEIQGYKHCSDGRFGNETLDCFN